MGVKMQLEWMLAFTCARRRRFPLGLVVYQQAELVKQLERMERMMGRGRRTQGWSSTREGLTWRSGCG